jgi:hypothetical protein
VRTAAQKHQGGGGEEVAAAHFSVACV